MTTASVASHEQIGLLHIVSIVWNYFIQWCYCPGQWYHVMNDDDDDDDDDDASVNSVK